MFKYCIIAIFNLPQTTFPLMLISLLLLWSPSSHLLTLCIVLVQSPKGKCNGETESTA